ncbi:hypothetical protein NPIL_496271 [Nephila pilipes]|uniref:Uncharacterized protein n=1 Tax=Nephila pilipes TaxID=299642 RepID=A0A8X6U646_NEPPI|nr:hypothetical protein NPIL_496271 [Nephila pilipes]
MLLNANKCCTEILPVVLGIRSILNPDIGASVAEGYGCSLSQPDEFFRASTANVLPLLREHMTKLQPLPASSHTNTKTHYEQYCKRYERFLMI